MNRSKVLSMVEGAVMIALAAVLGLIVVFRLPWGGSVTLLSMLPITMYSVKYGAARGLAAAFLFSLIQLGMGLADGLLAWGLTPVMLVGCIMLDYIIPFTLLGLSGMFRRKGITGRLAGTFIALFCRFVSHVLSGAVIFHSAGLLWEGFSTDNSFIYSAIYNGAYMLPEIIFTCVGAFALYKVPAIARFVEPVYSEKKLASESRGADR